ncbi:hypothetical protein C0389_09855 [bacterium]|nr:hypothetical protein [bacterium]
MKKILFVLAISLQLSVIHAQWSLTYGQVIKKISKENVMSGSLAIDSRIAFDNTEKVISNSPDNLNENKKSVLLAAGLSLLLPGAGEFYSESYIKSAAFIAVEAAALTLGLIYDKKGNDQTNLFQNYANGENGWSVVRYANWTLANARKLNPAVNPDDYRSKVFKSDGTVDWFWLNKLESAVSFNPNIPNVPGSFYSHNLPPRGSQQYYELIGKYQQFNVGWKQFGDDPNKSFTYDVDPLVFTEYTAMFYQADEYYNVASKAVIVVIINHIVSALDAAWTANSYNKNLVLNASLERRDYGYITVYYPRLNLQYRF